MQNDMQDQTQPPQRVRIRDFFYHLLVYLFVMAIIVIASGTGGAFVWLALFWGFAVAAHGIYAYFG